LSNQKQHCTITQSGERLSCKDLELSSDGDVSRSYPARAAENGLGICRGRRQRSRGFSLIELLVVIGILAVLLGLIIAAVAHARAKARSMQCLENLRQLTLGLHMYASENGDRFPDPQAAQTSWESVLQTYLQTKSNQIFICPGDGELGPLTGSSYDWRDTALPETTLAGKSVSDCNRLDAVLTLEALPGWHAKSKMNVGRMDGSCVTMGDQEAIGDLLKPIR
jgi:prepilin-type N-terminal cleavage/methylation domain-containing protein